MTTIDIALYKLSFDAMERAFGLLTNQVPPPIWTVVAGAPAYRFKEQSIQQAILLKCASITSRLSAAHQLLVRGFLQEQSALHRMAHEASEDVWYLAMAVIDKNISTRHQEYLTDFFAEETDDSGDPVKGRQVRSPIPRKKVRAYISEKGGTPDPHRHQEVGALIEGAYSGYVHGAAPHLMEMCWGNRGPQFHINGQAGSPLTQDHVADAWNFIYRGLLAYIVAATALESREAWDFSMSFTQDFLTKSGRPDLIAAISGMTKRP